MALTPIQDDTTQTMIATLYGVAAGAHSAERALEHLAHATGSDKAFIGIYNFTTQSGFIETSFNMEQHYVDAYREYHSQQNPWLQQAPYFQAEGLLWIGSEILPIDRLRQTEFYDLFLSPQAILHTLHAVIRVTDDIVTHLVLARTPEEDNYRPKHVEVCRLFSHHAKHAIEAREVVNTQQLVRHGLSEIMNQRGIGTAILDSEGRTLYVNEVCNEIVLEMNGSMQRSRFDSFTHAERAPRLELPRTILKLVTDHTTKLPSTIVCEKDEGKYPVIFHIHRIARNSVFGGRNNIAFAIVALDPERAVHLDADSICQAYHLTPSEARVSALIGTGERVEDTAAILGITPSTARTHLKRIFEKTRTNRQAELVKLLLDTARRGPIERHFRSKGPLAQNALVEPVTSDRSKIHHKIIGSLGDN